MNVGLSVSRVGSSAQIKAMKQVAGEVEGELAEYREMAAFAQFGSDLDARRSACSSTASPSFSSSRNSRRSTEEQVVVIYARIWLSRSTADWRSPYTRHIREGHADILNSIRNEKQITDATAPSSRTS